MKPVEHKISHHYQPTVTSCGYAALATLLSHYGRVIGIEDLLKQVPQSTDEKGNSIGSLTAQLAEWTISQGFEVDFTTFDFIITDLSWIGLDSEQLVERLEKVKHVRNVHNVGGKYWSEMYVQAYINLINSGGKLSVVPHVTTELLYEKLQHAPIYVNICPAVVYGKGRQRYIDTDELNKDSSVDDDLNGEVGTHSVIIYGNNDKGNFLISDPWEGLAVVDPEAIICGITAAVIECDSQLFQIQANN